MLEASPKLQGKVESSQAGFRGAGGNIFETWAVKSTFLQHKITELMTAKDIPAKMGVGGVMCTSSLSIPSDLFALSSKLRFYFLFQSNF